MNHDITQQMIYVPSAEDSESFLEQCKAAQIAAGTYHPDLEAILPVLSMDCSASMVHNNASVHGFILRERERCKKIALDEKVSGDTGTEGDAAYNQACEDIAAKIMSGE